MKCPFSGKVCLQPKDIQVTEIAGDKITTLHLCKECGQKYVDMPNAEVVTSMMDVTKSPNGESSIQVTSEVKKHPFDAAKTPIGPKCPGCGWTLKEIFATKRAGCAECYTFHQLLVPMTFESQHLHPEVGHAGKAPKSTPEQLIKKLEARMQEAIKNEDYEIAAKLRDEIQKLKADQASGTDGQA